jgi:hypothetical protein
MKTELILKQLNLGLTRANKVHISKLIEVVKMLQSIKNEVLSFERTETEILIGREVSRTQYGWHSEPQITVLIEGEKKPAEKITVRTKTGFYSQIVPVNCDLHRAFCSLLGVNVVESVKEGLIISKEVFSSLKLAQKIAKTKNIYRSDFKNVRLTCESNELQIIATDGHRLLRKTHKVESNDLDIFISADNLKHVNQGSTIRQEGKNYFIDSLFVESEEVNFPDYRNVWPEYTGQIEVNRLQLIEALKQARVTANKVTKQIKLHLNGKIDIQSADLDFGQDSIATCYYQSKTLPDFDICFNADFLIDGIEAFKQTGNGLKDTVKISHSGVNYKNPFLIDDCYLLMPVQPPVEYVNE